MDTKLTDFAKKVQQLRAAQKNFFQLSKTPKVHERNIALAYARSLEREIDELTEQILNTNSTIQNNLF